MAALTEAYSRGFVVDAVRTVLDRLRAELKESRREVTSDDVSAAGVAPWVVALVERAGRPSLRRVINALGVVGHTNLGRSLLPDTAVSALVTAARSYTDLEVELGSGARGSRQAHVRDIICTLTGAADAFVVNNNAAAILLALAATAGGGEVLISRGQLVEIGDGFRIPDLLRESGATLLEVGTTNRTYLSDFERAWTERTRAILRVHTSNYRIVGFAAEPGLEELVALAHDRDALLIDDLGSGALGDLSLFADEPSVRGSVASGADVVTFSGDKLLGGPQAGIAVGTTQAIGAMRAKPLARALRVDKLCVAALDAVLRLYLQPGQAIDQIPTLAMLNASSDTVAARARRLEEMVRKAMPLSTGESAGHGTAELRVIETVARAGAGSLPVTDVPSAGLAVRPADGDAAGLAKRLRAGEPPVLARVQDEQLVLDMRAVGDDELAELGAALCAALG